MTRERLGKTFVIEGKPNSAQAKHNAAIPGQEKNKWIDFLKTIDAL
jgi:hypothetical protein